MNSGRIEVTEVFQRLAADELREETAPLGGVNVRLARGAGGQEGRWDGHPQTAETVIVWSGDFTVEFQDHMLVLSAGQCCVIPVGVEHRGTCRNGAEIILFQQAG